MPRKKGPKVKPEYNHRPKGSSTSVSKKKHTRVIDWRQVAIDLEELIAGCGSGSVELDGRLWCLLHRVTFHRVKENPLIGARQVLAGVGNNWKTMVWYDIPALTTDFNKVHLALRDWDYHLSYSAPMVTVACPEHEVQRYDGDICLAVAQYICHCIAEGWDLEFNLPDHYHIKPRVRPQEIFLEAWAPKLTAGIPKFGPKPKDD